MYRFESGLRDVEKTYGQIAYEAYCEAIWEIRHQTLPTWEDQKADIRNAWEASGETVAQVAQSVEQSVEQDPPFQL